MDNTVLQDDPRYEIIDGQTVMMSPRPAINHGRISGNVFRIFSVYLRGKHCEVFSEMDVVLDEKNTVIPDVMIVCNPDYVKEKNIQGAPDLVVEILSPSTAKIDKKHKKELYEKHEVKEYWIIDPLAKSIEVYHLASGKLILNEIYMIYPRYEIEDMIKDGKEIITNFKASLYDDLIINLDEIFERVK